MSMNNWRNGLKAFGAPVSVGADQFAGWFGRTVWFVDGDNGSDGYSGKTPTRAKATIQAAITAAGAQDTIYIRTLAPDADASEPGTYEEDLTIPYAKHGLKLIGVNGTGSLQPFGGPKIKNATAAALLTVNASNVLIKGLQFNCTRNSGTYGILLNGVSGYATLAGSCGSQIVDCYIKNASDSYGGIYVEGGYCVLISRCTFHLGDDALGVYLNSNTIPSNGHTVEYCNFKSNNGTAVAKHLYARSTCKDLTIKGCTFDDATAFLSVDAACTGIITDCSFADTAATLANSTGKVTIPATQCVKVTGCWGGVSLAVIQSAA